MKNTLRNLLIPLMLVAVMLPLVTRASSAPRLPEDIFPSLRQILEDAAQQSPQMVTSNLDLLAADGALKQSKAGLYPTIGGFYQISHTRDEREDVQSTLNAEKNFYSLSLIQPLFHWSERRNTARIGEIRREIADENYQEAYRLLAQQIRASYMSLIIGKVSVRNAIYSQKLAAEAMALAEDRLKKKMVSEGEIFHTRVAAQQSLLDLEKTQWEFTMAKQDFGVLTGQPILATARIPSEIPGLNTDQKAIEQLLNKFLSQDEPDTPAARNLRKQLRIDDLEYRNQRTRLRPKLNFIAGISQDEQSFTSNTAQKFSLQTQYVGLQVSWNIFDGFASQGAVAAALAYKRTNEQHYKQLTEKLVQDAKRAAHTVGLAKRQLAINERLLNNAGNFLKYTQEDFKRGQASESQVNAAQAGYNQMSGSANSARYIYLLRVSEFVSLIAEDPMVDQFGNN